MVVIFMQLTRDATFMLSLLPSVTAVKVLDLKFHMACISLMILGFIADVLINLTACRDITSGWIVDYGDVSSCLLTFIVTAIANGSTEVMRVMPVL